MFTKPAPRLKYTAKDRENARALARRYMSPDSAARISAHETANVMWAIYSILNPDGDEIEEVVTRARAYAADHLSR